MKLAKALILGLVFVLHQDVVAHSLAFLALWGRDWHV